MPYIPQQHRKRYDELVNQLVETLVWDSSDADLGTPAAFAPGELNYVLSSLLVKLWAKGRQYYRGNTLMGVLECVKAEFYRRWLAPYEDGALARHGDLSVQFSAGQGLSETKPGGGG